MAPPPRPFLGSGPDELHGKRLLIVDDNATNRRILAMLADAWGMGHRTTASPNEALAWVQAGEHFDIAVRDMQMPEMDGAALAAALRREAHGAALPLVLLTSLGRREVNDATGFAAFLNKPIKPSQLFDVLVGTLAAPRPRQPERPHEASSLDAGMAARLPLRILLAEDNVTNQKLALRLLARMGYRADVAANGLEALHALERQPYDVVLMDMQMPEMDGLEATRQIHRRWSEQAHPYIVAMTANAMESDRQECLAAGMDDYVSKPVRVDALVAALEHAATALARRRDETAHVHEHNHATAYDASGSNGAFPPGDVASAEDTPPPANVALDAKALENLRAMVGDDASFLAELVNTFLEDAPLLLGDMRAAVAAGDAAALRLAAHSLKSNAAQFGATEFAALCKEIEGLGKAGDTRGASPLVEAAGAAYPGVAAALQAIA